jgi:hypothetical protein
VRGEPDLDPARASRSSRGVSVDLEPDGPVGVELDPAAATLAHRRVPQVQSESEERDPGQQPSGGTGR